MKIVTRLLQLALFSSLLCITGLSLLAQPGTRTTVQTFTYTSPQEGYFVLPPAEKRYEKILMHYRLRCPFDAQCGEWDYLMYIHLFDHTGRLDSTRDTAASYRVDGRSPDSFGYMTNPSWDIFASWQKRINYTDTTSLKSGIVGNGVAGTELPFAAGAGPGRGQYLWRSSELTAESLTAGDITGLRLHLASAGGSELRYLTIRMKSVTRDSLGYDSFETSGFTTVYSANTTFTSDEWQTIGFTTPFTWNGTSNVLVDISYDGSETPRPPTSLYYSSPSYNAGIFSGSENHSRNFEGLDYITVPDGALASVDSAITISFWSYGNPLYQPQDQSVFEGLDTFGRRTINLHLPWSDRSIYWDAGSGSTYDRLSKAADSTMWEGRWNHWTVTKNAKSRTMRIYLNGKQWATTSGKTKTMRGIKTFKIGSAGSGTNNYDGRIDEFAVWNAELTPAAIQTWMHKGLDDSHAFKPNLLLYYRFDESASVGTIADESGRNNTGRLHGLPGSRSVRGSEIFMNFAPTGNRPHVAFEQGVFTSRLDSTLVVDSIPKDPVQVIRYGDPRNPATPTDTLTVWPAYYRYSYDAQGRAIDSIPVAPDNTLNLVRTPYFKKFEITNRYELGRYITPYGNGLTLGEGFTWTYDVTDFKTLLHDTVHIAAYNQQELVDLSFEFIEGTPPRDPIKIENLWVGDPAYGTATSIENFLTPRRVKIDPAAANTRVKMITTGHGFGGTENCAEFCPKVHTIKVNNVARFDTVVWKEDCGLNPVYPQGGTWVYNRSNWCPGDDVPVYDLELTPHVTPGDSVTLDYDIQDYTWNGAGSTPYYRIETQLVSYSAPNFILDAAIEQIKAPSNVDVFRRMNPICGNPIITIKNTGSTPLTSLKITYGIDGGTPSVHTWTGNLKFLQSTDVQLSAFSWSGASHTFRVTVGEPNGGGDEYSYNNSMTSTYGFPPEYPSSLILELKTNNNPEESSYELRDAAGNVVFTRSDLVANTMYKDTLDLPNGCYEFRLRDLGENGLQWWANPDGGAGYMRVRNGNTNAIIKTFNPDFGSEIYQQFTVGYFLSEVKKGTAGENRMSIYPNPSNGELNIALELTKQQDATISVRDLLGRTIYERTVKDVVNDVVTLDLAGITAGIYIVAVQTETGVVSRKVVIQ